MNFIFFVLCQSPMFIECKKYRILKQITLKGYEKEMEKYEILNDREIKQQKSSFNKLYLTMLTFRFTKGQSLC